MASRGCRCASEVDLAAEGAREVEDAAARLRGHFRRPEAWDHARDYLRGLLAEVERKNGWQLAERAGYGHPRGIQRVLDRYLWDAEAVRDDLRGTSWRTWATRGRCWWSTRPASPSKGRTPRGWPGSTAGRWASGPTARWGSSWGTPPPRGTPGWTGPSTSRRSGPTTAPAAAPRAFPTRCPSAPSPSWPWPWWSGRWTRGCRRPGSSPTRCTATTASSAAPWRRATKPTSSPCAATTPSRPGRRSARRPPGRSRRWWPRRWRWGPRPGPAGAAVRGLKGPACTTGPTSPCGRRCGTRRGGCTPCSSAATPGARTRSPSIWSTPPPAPPSRRSSARPARGGRSRTPSSRPRGWWGSTTTRSAVGGAGTATSPWPCWPSPP